MAENIIKESADGAAIQSNLGQVVQAINKQTVDQNKKASMVAGMIAAVGAKAEEGKLDNIYGAVRAILDNFEATGSDTEASDNTIQSEGNAKAAEVVTEASLPAVGAEAEVADVTFNS